VSIAAQRLTNLGSLTRVSLTCSSLSSLTNYMRTLPSLLPPRRHTLCSIALARASPLLRQALLHFQHHHHSLAVGVTLSQQPFRGNTNLPRLFAQTFVVHSTRPSAHHCCQAQAFGKLSGGYLLPKASFAFSTSTLNSLRPLLPKTFLQRGFCSPFSISATMSTLSQPQTPAALHSPLREHRHRPVERLTDRLETPSLDDRSYRVVRLPNQLEVLLVHDAETDKASAAMDVNVGNFSDEEDMPGMAHAVEVSTPGL
jgi:hypothetical protein